METVADSSYDRSRRASPKAFSGLLAIVVLACVAALSWLGTFENTSDRVEREHSITLPASTRDIQAMGDASSPLLRAIGLDRGASTILQLDRSELHELLDEFGFDTELSATRTGFAGAPVNSQYQPKKVPWDGGIDATPEAVYFTSDPPGSGDFASVEVFSTNEVTVAVWLYTDWN